MEILSPKPVFAFFVLKIELKRLLMKLLLFFRKIEDDNWGTTKLLEKEAFCEPISKGFLAFLRLKRLITF